ncbi:hypothetical protein Vadar_030645 [Vaccinium darrowii]|uniref:Uncharacterized protein n=1 Tax=Vaccinium darrowii TaxID=229202 RepID=A0ACB7ZGG8_9ERIC|nr:hypothetical protein Vadar_030645 [Vaccinium darrowii]
MGSHGMGQQPHLQPLARQNSWFSLTLGEIENQCGDFGKPLGSMNLDELLKNVWTSEATQSSAMDIESSSPASSLQRHASLTLARAFNGKTVDEVWRDIQQGQKVKNVEDVKGQERDPTLDDITLEEFLVKAGHFAEVPSGPLIGVDNAVTTQKAYHNELVGKVSCLEEENIKLKKEKELEKLLPWELSPEPRYQLRRTNSF